MSVRRSNRTATADGTGSGRVQNWAEFVSVTSDSANKIITLPAPVVGRTVALRNGATGYELRSNAPGSVKINGGSGANAESAIPADTLIICVCDTATTWVCSNVTAAGIVSATEVASA
jgi:hypothetical protein